MFKAYYTNYYYNYYFSIIKLELDFCIKFSCNHSLLNIFWKKPLDYSDLQVNCIENEVYT